MDIDKQIEDLLVRSFHYGMRLYDSDVSRPVYDDVSDSVLRARVAGWDTAQELERIKQQQIQALLKTSEELV